MSRTSSFLKRRWKLILNIVTVVALLGLVYAIRDQLAQTIENFKHVNGWFILLMVPIEALNYHAQVRMYQRLFRLVGNDLKYGLLLRASLELNFVNHVFPSGGVTGISYFSLRLRNRDGQQISATKATVVHAMKLVLIFLSFEVLLIAGLFFLAIKGKASNLTMLVTGSLSTLLIMGTLGFSYVIGSRTRIHAFFTAVTKVLNKIIQLVRPNHPETINIDKARQTFDDFHDNYVKLNSSVSELRVPFWYALLANATEVLALYTVYIAFGHPVNLGAVILAYAVANFAGLISVLPGGIGVYEAIMTAVLAAGGVPPSISIPVTIMYRVVNTLIQIPIGYVFYHRALTEPEAIKA